MLTVRLSKKRSVRRSAGIGLLEAVLLLSVIATALAAALPAFVRALRLSKISEASEQLAEMQKGIAVYYAASHETEGGVRSRCLPIAAGPTPEAPSTEPREVDFAAPATVGAASWQAIGFEPAAPLRFRYTLLPSDPGCAEAHDPDEGRSIVLRAEGDLDGDGNTSLFERTLQTTRAGLAVEPVLVSVDRTE